MKIGTVSVIIPVYNGEGFIENALNSVLSQSYKEIEIIVVDDGSTDNTLGVVEKYESVITVIKQEHTGTPSTGRNRGAKQCNGEFVAFLDADDVWDKDKVSILHSLLKKNDKVMLAFSDFNRFDCANGSFYPLSHSQINRQIHNVLHTPISGEEKAFLIPKGKTFNLLLEGYWISPCTVLVRRKLLDLVGSWNESLVHGEDADFFLRCAKLSGFIYVDRTLTSVGRHDHNLSRNILHQDTESVKMFDIQLRNPIYNRQERKAIGRAKAWKYCALGYNYLERKEYREARKYYKNALRNSKTVFHALVRLLLTVPVIDRMKRSMLSTKRILS